MTADERRTGPLTGHAGLDTLADLHAGALAGPEAARVREHVAGCRDCAATLAALDTVQVQLRSLPAPGMPAAVVARLDATIADLRSGSAPVAVPAPTGPAQDPEDELALARARRGRRLSRAIGAAAAAVVVIAAGGAVVSIVRNGGDTDETSAGSAASAPVQSQDAGAGLGPKSTSRDSTEGGAGEAAVPAYDQASLRAALPTIAAEGTSVRQAALADPGRREACAASIPGTTGSLRAAARIVYQSEPGYVLVYDSGGRLTGFVVTDSCGSTPGQPAVVLATIS